LYLDNQINKSSHPKANFATNIQIDPQQNYTMQQNIASPGDPRSMPNSPPIYSIARTTLSNGNANNDYQRQNSGGQFYQNGSLQQRVTSSKSSSNNEYIGEYGTFAFDSMIQGQNEAQPRRDFRSVTNSRVNSQAASPVHQFSGPNSPLMNHGFGQIVQGSQQQQNMPRGSLVLAQPPGKSSPLSPLMNGLQIHLNPTLQRQSSGQQQNMIPQDYGYSAPNSPLMMNEGINDSMAPFFNQ
jgi:hypothetical protein